MHLKFQPEIVWYCCMHDEARMASIYDRISEVILIWFGDQNDAYIHHFTHAWRCRCCRRINYLSVWDRYDLEKRHTSINFDKNCLYVSNLWIKYIPHSWNITKNISVGPYSDNRTINLEEFVNCFTLVETEDVEWAKNRTWKDEFAVWNTSKRLGEGGRNEERSI